MAKDRSDPPEKRPATERRDARIVDAASWPIGRAELSALIDVGMSDRAIAAYFGVDESEVAALRGRHGLTAETARVESMRREARQLVAESQRSADPGEKIRLAEQAFELAQLAEGLERRAATAATAADAAAEPETGPPAGPADAETPDALLDKAKRWRMRAEEYRTVAEALVHSPSARLTYLHLADSYDALANQTEARARLAGQKRKASG